MTDKQPAPVGDCHIVGKAVVSEFSELEGSAKRFQELMLNASMALTGKKLEELTEAMEAYRQASAPSVILSLLRQNADLKAERDAECENWANQCASLIKERDALAAENALTHSHPSFASMMEALDIFFADEDVPERAMLTAHKALLPKRSPATDAAIAEWKAQGALVVRDALVNAPDGIGIYGFVSDVAASLRKGGAE